MGRGKSHPIVHLALFFPSPQSPYDTKRPLRQRVPLLLTLVGRTFIGIAKVNDHASLNLKFFKLSFR